MMFPIAPEAHLFFVTVDNNNLRNWQAHELKGVVMKHTYETTVGE